MPLNCQKSSYYLIENVTVWSAFSEPTRMNLLIKDGHLHDLAPSIPFEGDRIDGRGFALIPCGVDAQTHLRVPGQSNKETAFTGLRAALKGGYSAILTMPNTSPVIDSLDVLLKAKEEVRQSETDHGVRVLWSAAITKNLDSSQLTNFYELVDAGVAAFTNDGLGVQSDEVMDQAFSMLQDLNVPLLQHAEFLTHGGILAPGPVQKKLSLTPYPEEVEWQMVERDMSKLRKYPDARYHVLHVSSRKTVDLVRDAKNEGLKVTAEVSPHHLYFNVNDISETNLSFKMNPPIRTENDQKALWDALIDGAIDFVATDHAPHEGERKSGTFDDAAYGTLGLETTIKVLIKAWQEGRISSQRLVQVFSYNPARFLKLPAGFGDFTIGAQFHGVLVDVESSATEFKTENLSSLSKNSCFIGQSLPGIVSMAFHNQMIFSFD
jgi:dihydroorotase